MNVEKLHAVFTMITALGFNFSLKKSDKKAYDKVTIDDIPNPWINWATITVGIDFCQPPIAVNKRPTLTIEKQINNANFLLLVSETKLMTNSPKMLPKLKIDWIRFLAH